MTALLTDMKKANDLSIIAKIGVLTAAAIVVHYFESFLPPLIPGIPVKLGLANIFTILTLIRFGKSEALLLTIIRCTVAPILSGSVTGVMYSLVGGLFAVLAMIALLPLYKKEKASTISLSVAGAFCFNIGQLGVGVVLNGAAMLIYFPFMSLLSLPTGVLTAFVTSLLLNRLTKKCD